MRPRWTRTAAGVAATVLTVAGLGWGTSAVAATPGQAPAAATAELTGDPVVMVAGDIACAPGSTRGRKCRDDLTAQKLADATHVLTVGDNQYNCGQLSAYYNAYDKTWGQYLDKTYPVVGEDEYSGGGCSTPGASGYFTYFASRAQQGGCTKSCKGWYSYDIGASWHVVALNTACDEPGVGGCGATSAQVKWLKQDLANTGARCIMAVMHRPYWSNGNTVRKFKPIIQALYDGGADVVLTGNSHLYARYAQQNPESKLDTARGMRAFIVGTGGKSHSTLASPRLPNFQAGNDTTFGVLRLDLGASSYDWKYVQAYPASPVFSDTGTTTCH
jgi:acid phosphatase type 7